jgi:hypothetical protein
MMYNCQLLQAELRVQLGKKVSNCTGTKKAPIIELKRKMEVKLIRSTGSAMSWEQAAGTGHTKVQYSQGATKKSCLVTPPLIFFQG